MDKKALRKFYKDKRDQLSEYDIGILSKKIAGNANLLDIWNNNTFHVYLSIKDKKEINTQPLIDLIWGKNKHVISSTCDMDSLSMNHYYIDKSTELKENKYNIPEPVDAKEIEVSKIDVVFVPLLAYDISGNRIGYGKGFYDIFMKEIPNAMKIGLSFFYPENQIEEDVHDVKIDLCITPDAIFNLRAGF